MRFPANMSVVGCNDAFVDKFHAPLTTVRVSHHEIGAEAARILLETIEEGYPPRPRGSLLMRTSVIVRGSTAPDPAGTSSVRGVPRRVLRAPRSTTSS
jgi:LacI family transcriptional regulator